MSWTHLEEKRVQAREGHQCCLCEGPIQSRAVYIRRTGVDEDGFITMKMHVACRDFATTLYERNEHMWENHDPSHFRQEMGIAPR